MEIFTLDSVEGKVFDGFKILDMVGKGASSHVHIAIHLLTKRYVAAKIINLNALSNSEYEGVTREISVFMQVSHPNIARLIRLSLANNLLIFFMELTTAGTLKKYVVARKGLTEEETFHFFTQIISVFYYLQHKHFIVHRDIKLENILIDKDKNVKIIDFGLSDVFYMKRLKHCVGTPGYQAPEVLNGAEYNEKCDTWSLGVTLHALLTGYSPFSSSIRDARALTDAALRRPMLSGISDSLQDFIGWMLEPVVAKRPTIAQAICHPWLKRAVRPLNNITPRPVIFYQVPSYEDILKFKRKPEGVVKDLLDKTARLGIDRELLMKQLENGDITDETTTYFVLSLSSSERPPPMTARLPPLKKGKVTKPRMAKRNPVMLSARQFKRAFDKKGVCTLVHHVF